MNRFGLHLRCGGLIPLRGNFYNPKSAAAGSPL
jgi:hypothetical protein